MNFMRREVERSRSELSTFSCRSHQHANCLRPDVCDCRCHKPGVQDVIRQAEALEETLKGSPLWLRNAYRRGELGEYKNRDPE